MGGGGGVTGRRRRRKRVVAAAQGHNQRTLSVFVHKVANIRVFPLSVKHYSNSEIK